MRNITRLSRLAAVAVLTGLVSWAVVAAPSPAKTPPSSRTAAPAPPPAVTLSAEEQLILRLLNRARADHHLRALRVDPVLTRVAREHNADMAKRDYFSHVEPGPEGRDPLDRYAKAIGHLPTEVVGENLGMCTAPQMSTLHEALMKSPDHRANILDEEYVRVGIGVLVLPDGRTWVTQMFCGDPAPAPNHGRPNREPRGRGDDEPYRAAGPSR